MIKLTRVEVPHPVIRVEGRLDGQSVPELHAMASAGAGAVDLTGLVSVDRAGAEALARLRRAGWRITGASLYVESLLEEAQA